MKKIVTRLSVALLVAIGIFFSQVAEAQTIQVSGKVLSAKDNSPLENITVRPAGSKKGTATKQDGSFKIEIQKGQSLEFSSVNMLGKTVKNIDSPTNSLMVVMEESDNNLSEVMVVAYGTQKKEFHYGFVLYCKSGRSGKCPEYFNSGKFARKCGRIAITKW